MQTTFGLNKIAKQTTNQLKTMFSGHLILIYDSNHK